MALGVDRIVVALGSHGQQVQKKCRNLSGLLRRLRRCRFCGTGLEPVTSIV
jgi:hypothetical protein